jgi:succinate dehydrogenase/fumarate reductase-like Fe-S protein
VLKGYRGFARELSHTGTWRALWLQVRTGAAHALRQVRGREAGDPVARFFENYAADGFRMPDAAAAVLQLRAETCLVCGLCSAECARVGGEPPLDPRDAVVAAARLAIDWTRLAVTPVAGAAACAGCAACDTVCPVAIPIHRVQGWLAERG